MAVNYSFNRDREKALLQDWFDTVHFSQDIPGGDLPALDDTEDKSDLDAFFERKAGDARQLREYWVHGEGAARINWGTTGAFRRCVAHLEKHVTRPQGLCAIYYHSATGHWPGENWRGKKKSIEELLVEVKTRYVRTAAGARKYGKPIGSPIDGPPVPVIAPPKPKPKMPDLTPPKPVSPPPPIIRRDVARAPKPGAPVITGERPRHYDLFRQMSPAQAQKMQDDMLGDESWTPDEVNALNSYSSIHYRYINRYLRGDSTALDEYEREYAEDGYKASDIGNFISDIHSSMRPSTENVMVGRAMWDNVFTGDPGSHVGKVYQEPSFMSTTIQRIGGENTMKQKPHVLYLHAPKGTPMAYVESVSDYPEEQEILFDAGTKFRIDMVIERGDKTYFHGTVLRPGSDTPAEQAGSKSDPEWIFKMNKILDDIETKTKYVRTAAGAKKYGKPIGSPIGGPEATVGSSGSSLGVAIRKLLKKLGKKKPPAPAPKKKPSAASNVTPKPKTTPKPSSKPGPSSTPKKPVPKPKTSAANTAPAAPNKKPVASVPPKAASTAASPRQRPNTGSFRALNSTEAQAMQDSMNAKYGPWQPATRDKMSMYSGLAYRRINGTLRRDPKYMEPASVVEVSGWIDDIDAGLHPLPHGIVVHRVVNDKADYSAFPDGPDSVGKIYQEPGFMSTTITRTTLDVDPSVPVNEASTYKKPTLPALIAAPNNRTHIHLNVPAGTRAAYIESVSGIPEEEEMLLHPGVKFRVDEWKVLPNGDRDVTVTVVP